MADDVLINPTTGINVASSIAADEIGGVKYPRTKVVIGADGTNAGDVSAANPLPVTLPAGQVPPAAITGYAIEIGGNLAEIKTNTDNIPALGQALAAASVPVVLTAAQITTLTPPAAITNFANETGGNLATIKSNTDIPTLSHASSNGTPITTNTNTSAVAAPAAGHHLRIFRIQVSNGNGVATWVYFRDGVAGTLLYPIYLSPGSIVSLRLDGTLVLTGGGTPLALYINTATAGASIEWHVDYKDITE